MSFDALLLLSFGGPDRPEDVIPFLKNITEGKNVPEERLRLVAEHYDLFDGASPANAEMQALLFALVNQMNHDGPQLPVYWANRYWHPDLPEVIAQMASDGIRRALAFVPSPFGSHASCRQYIDAIEAARQQVTDAPPPEIEKLRLFYNHPGYIEPIADRIFSMLSALQSEANSPDRLIFTAHSLPLDMAKQSAYVEQYHEAARLIARNVELRAAESGLKVPQIATVYQSRSGPPHLPWLGPDVGEYVASLAETDQKSSIVVCPIGFCYENMETAYDLDVALARQCEELGIEMHRVDTIATDPKFVEMIRLLALERIDKTADRLSLGDQPPWPDACDAQCCK